MCTVLRQILEDEGEVACRFRELPVDCYSFYFTPLFEVSTVEEATSWVVYFLGGMAVIIILLIATLYFRKRKQNAKTNRDLIRIGRFQFDQKEMTLELEAQSITLSAKESDLLYLLFSNENKTLERAYILKVVWGDDGDYVGRTLDVFISKLRKKLVCRFPV